MPILDYLYYRLCEFCKGFNSDTPNQQAIIMLSALECIFFYDAMLIVKRLFGTFLISPSPGGFIFFAFVLLIINFVVYGKNKRLALEDKWSSESIPSRSNRGTIIIIAIVLLLGFPIMSISAWGPPVKW